MSAVIRTHDKEKWAASYKIRSLEEKRRIEQLEPGMRCTFTGSLEQPAHATIPGVLIIRNIFTLSRFTGYLP